MMRPLLASVVFVALSCTHAAAQPREDVLLIERVEAAQDVPLPRRGALMNEVERQFGAPTLKHATVGGASSAQPPITRWDYPAFSVYFENSHVVNAVVRKMNALEIGPKSPG